MTLVSVVIPTFNRREYVRLTVASVLEQTYRPIEVIVVDDGSSDDTADALRTQFGDRIRVVELPRNFGRSAARNIGGERATGELIAFLDADDLWHPEKIAKQVPAFADPNVALVHTWAGKIDAKGNWLERESTQLAQAFAAALERGYDYGGITETWCRLYTSAAMVRREAFLASGGFDTLMSSFEDWDVLWRIARGKRVVTIPEQLLLHRLHEGNTPTVWAEAAVPWIRLCSKHLDEMPRVSCDASMRRARHNLLLNRSLGEYWRGQRSASRRYMLRALLVSPRPLRNPKHWVWGAPLASAFLPRQVANIVIPRLPVDQYTNTPPTSKHYPPVADSVGSVTLVADDAPTAVTTQLLDTLEAAGHRAVLFILGKWIGDNRPVLIDAIRRGFALGNHSYSHPHFSEIDLDTARAEILQMDALIGELYAEAGIRRPGKWFRFPYLDTGGDNYHELQSFLRDLGYSIPDALKSRLSTADRDRCDWPSTVLARDWALPSQEEFRATVMKTAAGDIVEFHDKVETVAPYIDSLKDCFRVRSVRGTVPATMPRRVLVVSWWLDSLGGMERHITELACALVRAGTRVDYLSEMPLPATNMYRQQMVNGGVTVRAAEPVPTVASQARDLLKAAGVLTPARFMWRKFVRLRYGPPVPPAQSVASGKVDSDASAEEENQKPDPSFLAALEGIFAGDDRPDVLHLHGIRIGQSWIIDWAHAHNVPCVYTEHVSVAEFGGPFRKESPAMLMKAGAVACVSEHARRSLLSVLPEERKVAVSNHIVRTRVAPAATAADAYRWLSIARLEHNKGIDVLLNAFAACVKQDPRFALVLAGDGSQRERYEALARELAIESRVTFRGILTSDELSTLMHSSAGVVLASRSEAMPVSIVEAMAHGKAIVATRVGGIPELLEDGVNGVMVDAEDTRALACGMIRLSTDHSFRNRIEPACRVRFAEMRFHEGTVLDDVRALYSEAILSTIIARAKKIAGLN